MSDPYISEIRMMAFNFAPRGWALCNGQTLAIQQNAALFALIGTTYGGNGVQTFQLPNLQGRVPLHMGPGFVQGQTSGEVSHTLTVPEMAFHNHLVMAKNAQADLDAAGTVPATNVVLAQAAAQTTPNATNVNLYGTLPVNSSLNFAPGAIAKTVGDQPHPNQQPYLAVTFCISLSGIFPSRS